MFFYMVFFCICFVYKCACVLVWARIIRGFYVNGVNNGQVYVVLMEWLTFG